MESAKNTGRHSENMAPTDFTDYTLPGCVRPPFLLSRAAFAKLPGEGGLKEWQGKGVIYDVERPMNLFRKKKKGIAHD
jgi:hypothetical protein